MVKDTNEYMEVTSKMIGDWSATGLTLDDEAVLGSKYEKMTAKFDFSSRTVKFTLYVTEGKIADMLLDWKKEYPGISVDEYKITSDGIARRSLKNVVLSYLVKLETAEVQQLCFDQFGANKNMTDVMSAFSLIANSDFSQYLSVH